MSFRDIYLPSAVPGYPCISVPRTKTSILVTAGGGERRNQEWEHPLHCFILPEAPGRDWQVVESLKNHWLNVSGPAYSFPFRDPLDFASCLLTKPNLVPATSDTDQEIGIGTGFTTSFQLVKKYTTASYTYTRTIHLPVLATVEIAIDSVPIPDTDYSISRPGGIVTFDVAPGVGAEITAGFLFDCEVRFENDNVLESVLRSFQVGGFADITLVEVRAC